MNGGRSNPAGVTEFRRMCCRTRGGGSPELEPCDWRRDRLTRRRGDAERGHWDGKPGCHRLVHGGRRWSIRDRPLTPRSPRLRVRSLPDGHGCAALSGLVSSGVGYPGRRPSQARGLPWAFVVRPVGARGRGTAYWRCSGGGAGILRCWIPDSWLWSPSSTSLPIFARAGMRGMLSTSCTTTGARPRNSPMMFRSSWRGFGRPCAVIHDRSHASSGLRTG